MTTTTLFTNVNVFDGKSEKFIEKANVLVEGNEIKTISTKKIEASGATKPEEKLALIMKDGKIYKNTIK